MHPDVIAWNKFEEENRELFELRTIGSDPQYLKNRLHRAFQAGLDHARSPESLQAFHLPHVYYSTACIHNLHQKCNLVCKYGEDPVEPCICKCHNEESK